MSFDLGMTRTQFAKEYEMDVEQVVVLEATGIARTKTGQTIVLGPDFKAKASE